MTVKANAPETFETLSTINWNRDATGSLEQEITKAHGRIERRRIQTMTPLRGTANYPHLSQICRIQREREMCKSGKKSTEIAYGITSVPEDRGTPENLLAWNRSHWSVENRNHRARDVNFREDACVGHTTHAPFNGAICNSIAPAIILKRSHRGRELAYASPPAQIPACALTHGAPASDDDEGQLARLRVLKPIAVTRETPTQSRLRKCVLHRLVGSAEWSFPPAVGFSRRHERLGIPAGPAALDARHTPPGSSALLSYPVNLM